MFSNIHVNEILVQCRQHNSNKADGKNGQLCCHVYANSLEITGLEN